MEQPVPYRILAPDGSIIERRTLLDIGLSGTDIIALYETMIMCRELHDHGSKEGHTDRMTIFLGPLGHEATIGSVAALGAEVWLYPYGRSWHVAIARGVAPKSVFDGFYANPSKEAIKDFFDHRSRIPYVAVGAQIPHAVGAAWAPKLCAGTTVPAASYFGDGATAQGDFHGAMSLAKIRHIPALFFCENNQWAISTPVSLTCPTATLADRARGYDIPAVSVDGNDLFACFAAGAWAYGRAKEHSEPSFVELVTYRLGEHTTAVGELIVIPKEELKTAWENEPILRMRRFLLSDAAQELFNIEWSEKKDAALIEQCRARMRAAAEASYREFAEAKKNGAALIRKTTAWMTESIIGEPFKKLAKAGIVLKKIPKDDDHPGAGVRDAIGIAAFDAMRVDPSVVWIGQDVARGGGVNRTSALMKRFIDYEPAVKKILPNAEEQVLRQYLPLAELFPGRLVDMPLNEALIAAAGFGLALGDGDQLRARPIIEMQFSGFVRFALHHIEEHSRHGFDTTMLDSAPGVYFLPSGTGERIKYHRDVELSLFTNNPALIVAFPCTPQDYYDMFFAAIASNRPVVFFAHIDLYREPKTELIRKPPSVPIEEFRPRLVSKGEKITIVSYGRMVYECARAISMAAEQEPGFSADLFDIRLIKPLHTDEIAESVKKTGRLLCVQEEATSFGTGAELVRRITHDMFTYLQAPPEVLGPPDTFTPPTKFWNDFLPQAADIAKKMLDIAKF